jgi:hypothetical protein
LDDIVRLGFGRLKGDFVTPFRSFGLLYDKVKSEFAGFQGFVSEFKLQVIVVVNKGFLSLLDLEEFLHEDLGKVRDILEFVGIVIVDIDVLNSSQEYLLRFAGFFPAFSLYTEDGLIVIDFSNSDNWIRPLNFL